MDRGEVVPERGAFVPKPKAEDDDGLPQDDKPPAKEKPETPPKPAVKPQSPAPEDIKNLKVPEVRKNYEALLKRVSSELEPEVTRLRSEVAELKQRAPVDTKPYEEKVTAAEKRIADQEALIRFLDYEKSAEFNDNYATPYRNKWNEALENLSQYKVEMPDGSTRPATEKDLIALGQMDLGDRRKAANAMFGDSADDVMAEVRDVVKLAKAQENALHQAKINAAKFAEENKVKSAESARARDANWQTQNDSLAQKYPKWFAPDAEDSEGSTLLKKGFAIADLVFSAKPPDEATKQLLPKSFLADLEANKGRLSPEGQTRLHALIRNKAAGFDRLARQVKSLSTQLEEANKKLAAYEDTEPPTGGDSPAGGGVVGDYLEDSNAELDKLDKLSR